MPTQSKPAKNAAAVTLGRLGGLEGCKTCAAKLSPRERRAIARRAAAARTPPSELVIPPENQPGLPRRGVAGVVRFLGYDSARGD